MFDTIGGIPLHPLVVHAVVVLAPLVGLGVVLYASVPRWRHGLRWPLTVGAVIAAGSAALASSSGESLEARVSQARSSSPAAMDLLHEHTEAGDLAAFSCYVLLAAVLLTVFVLAPVGKERPKVFGLVVAVAAAGFMAFTVFNAGHTGATSVWHNLVATTTGGGSD